MEGHGSEARRQVLAAEQRGGQDVDEQVAGRAAGAEAFDGEVDHQQVELDAAPFGLRGGQQVQGSSQR